MNKGQATYYLDQLETTESKWFAVYTKYRAEKHVARQLIKKGIECYVPINKVVKEYTRKKKVLELPLINCYAFVKITREQYVRALETEYVTRFVTFANTLVPIPEEEIYLLKLVCREIENVEAGDLTFDKGAPVEILSGNLTGVSGWLIDDLGKNFLIELQYIGIGLRVEVDPKFLRKIPGRKLDIESDQNPGLLSKYL